MKKRLILVIAFTLSACSVKNVDDPDRLVAGPYPDGYIEAVKNEISKTFFDPYSLRDVSISDPVSTQETVNLTTKIVGGDVSIKENVEVAGWLVCVQMNAKNRLGGYVGLRRTSFLVKNNKVVATKNSAAVCNNVSLKPWPEMENIAQKPKTGSG